MGNRVELDAMGKKILDASRTELYLSMRFLGPALHSLDFIMDLSTTSVGTDAAYIRFNPNYLFRLYVDRPRLLNRTWLHMLLHCLFRHMFTAREREDPELWDLSCDIAVGSIIDSMDYHAVAELTPEFRQRWYDRLQAEIRILTAERIYQYFLERKRNYLEELQLAQAFALDDHSFWQRMEDDEGDDGDDRGSGQDPDRADQKDPDGNRGGGRPDQQDPEQEERDDQKDPGQKEQSKRQDSEQKNRTKGQHPEQKNRDDRQDPDRNRGKQGRKQKGNDDRRRKAPGEDNEGNPERSQERDTEGGPERDPGRSQERDPGRSPEIDSGKFPPGSRRRQERLPNLKKTARELESDWEENAKRMEAELLASGKEASGERGSLDRILAISNRRRTDYREFLRKFAILREITTIDPDSFDYGFYNYGLEVYGNMPLIEENEYREANQLRTLVIAIDTSASCQDTLVQRFLNETAAVLRSIGQFFTASDVWIVECDEHVQQTLVLHSVEDLEKYADAFHVKGGFGTDFRPVFAWVEEMRRTQQIRDMEGLMYFTDGMGIYPDKPTDYDTAFVFFNDDELDDSKVPDWAVRLYIEGGKVRRADPDRRN